MSTQSYVSGNSKVYYGGAALGFGLVFAVLFVSFLALHSSEVLIVVFGIGLLLALLRLAVALRLREARRRGIFEEDSVRGASVISGLTIGYFVGMIMLALYVLVM